jgi:hypothetical protein
VLIIRLPAGLNRKTFWPTKFWKKERLIFDSYQYISSNRVFSLILFIKIYQKFKFSPHLRASPAIYLTERSIQGLSRPGSLRVGKRALSKTP